MKENENEVEEKINEREKNMINLKFIKSIEGYNGTISSISIFPSGNIISVSFDKSIKIYDEDFNILQNILNAHEKSIVYVDIKDDNNFVTCSGDLTIKTWIKKENAFNVNKIIDNAHNDVVRKVLYYSNRYLISCSTDYTVKIWEEINDIYQNILTISNSSYILSLLLIENKKILVSAGYDGTKFWALNVFKLINHFEDTHCGSWNALCRIDEDNIIVNGNDQISLKIISISQNKIIKNIEHTFTCYSISLIYNKGIFLVGGHNKDIEIFKNDNNYKCIQTITDAHSSYILGFIELKNGTIVSYGHDQIIKIWKFID